MKKKAYLTKIEIATYLRDYTRLMIYASLNTNKDFYTLFKIMLKDDNRLQYAIHEYYNDMINIYCFFLANKIYSFLNDISFDYLLEKNIDSVTISDDIFVNSSDFNRFSKKQIIKFIRNSINHNDKNEQELYKLYKDGNDIKIEIFLKNTKPVPFHIIMNITTYALIMNNLKLSSKIDAIVLSSKEPLNFSNGNFYDALNSVFYRKYYIKEKVSMETLIKVSDAFRLNQGFAPVSTHLSPEVISYVDYELTTPQKLKIEEDLIEWYHSVGIDPYDSIGYILRNVIPHGIAKLPSMDFGLILANGYVAQKKSIQILIDDAKHVCYSKSQKKNPLYLYSSKYGTDMRVICSARDFDSIINNTSSIYYSYLFDTLITDDMIKIGENQYSREKVRNSFVHSRWFIGVKNSFKLFDGDNGTKNDLNHNWRASIPSKQMAIATETYYQNYLKQFKLENKHFLDYPIVIRIDENTNIPLSITFIKNFKTYIYNLNINSYSWDFLPWGLYIAEGNQKRFVDNVEESKLFFDELSNLLSEDKRNYELLIEILYEQYLKCLQYRQAKLTLEELKRYDNLVLSYKSDDCGFEKSLN